MSNRNEILHQARLVSKILCDSPRHYYYGQKIRQCADSYAAPGKLRACGIRLCPICQGRTRRTRQECIRALGAYLSDHPQITPIGLCLSKPASSRYAISEALDGLGRAVNRFLGSTIPLRSAKACIKAFQIKRTADGLVNVHSHVIAAMPDRRSVPDQARLTSLWEELAEADQAHVWCEELRNPTAHCAYIARPPIEFTTELLADEMLIPALMDGLENRRLFTVTGELKHYRTCDQPASTARELESRYLAIAA